jgi:hypothetical protein
VRAISYLGVDEFRCQRKKADGLSELRNCFFLFFAAHFFLISSYAMDHLSRMFPDAYAAIRTDDVRLTPKRFGDMAPREKDS